MRPHHGPWHEAPLGPEGGPRRRHQRGRLRQEILRQLAERPMHGYELMQRIAERTGGMWQPSPGSIYPTLAMLEDAGLVTSSEEDGRRIYTLTEPGRESVEAHAPEDARFDEMRATGRELRATMEAFRQVLAVGNPAQIERAQELVSELRRELYRLLAED